ncbi:MAG: hypothetical protein EOQ66_28720, partial [Mesorhizobium sp.]
MTVAIAGGKCVQRRDIGGPVGGEHGMAAIGPKHAGGCGRVTEFQPVPRKILAERGIGRRGDEEDEGRRHHVMDEAGRRDLIGAHAAADAVVAFEHEHLGALGAKHRRADQGVDAAADHIIVGS